MRKEPMLARPVLWIVLVAITLLPTLASSATTSEPARSDDPLIVLAVVNGEEITSEDLQRSLEVMLASAAARDIPPELDLAKVLHKVVNDTLIAQEARSLGINEEPPIPERVLRYRQNVALARFEKERITEPSQPTAEQIEQAFQDQYRRATFHIATTYTREEAEALLAELEGGASISDLASERSVDPYRMRDGLVDDVPNIRLQRAIADIVFRLSPGQTAGPIPTDLGWSVLTVDSFAPADREKFAELEPKLSSLARQANEEAIRAQLAQELRRSHPVVVDQDIVDAMEPKTTKDGRLTADSPNGEAIVARIGTDGAVTAEEYAEALRERWKRVRNIEAARAAAPIILDGLIEKQLLMAGAKTQGYDTQPKTERAVHYRESQLVISKYLNEVLSPTIDISEEEKRDYYEKHKQNYRKPPKVRLAQITVPSREEADKVVDLFHSDAEISWIAEQFSTDQYKESGGDRGWHQVRAELPDYNQDLLAARPGDVLGPYEESDSWVILKVLQREDQGTYTLQEISGNVRSAAYTEKVLASIEDLTDALRDLSEIEIHEDALESIRITPAETGLQTVRTEPVHGH